MAAPEPEARQSVVVAVAEVWPIVVSRIVVQNSCQISVTCRSPSMLWRHIFVTRVTIVMKDIGVSPVTTSWRTRSTATPTFAQTKQILVEMLVWLFVTLPRSSGSFGTRRGSPETVVVVVEATVLMAVTRMLLISSEDGSVTGSLLSVESLVKVDWRNI